MAQEHQAVTGELLVRLTWHEGIRLCRREAITPHVPCRDWSRHDLFFAAWTAGPSHDERCRLVRDAWDLAQKVTHGDLSRVDAFAAAQKAVL